MSRGHSISGAAGLIAANNTPQIKGVVNLDGDVNDDFEKIQPSQPILYITTQPHGSKNPDTSTWNEDKSEKRRDNAFLNNAINSAKSIRIKIPEMYHLDFLDVAYYKSSLPEKSKRQSFGCHFYKIFRNYIRINFLFIEDREDWRKLKNKYGLYVELR